ncbi:MAG: transporter substrate-binding domain-containing protein [Deltaproteobacteria bacterium]|nr:transporter substrate-binding domain-containing protein [Deltaproteobacteria bacterium]
MRARQPLVILLLSLSAFSARGQDLVFTTIEKQPIMTVASEIVKELYRRLGHEISVVPMAAARAAAEVSSNHVDGEVGRIVSFNENYPNLLRVPTHFYSAYTRAFVRVDRGITKVDSGNLKNYRVARIRGVVNTDLLSREVPEAFDFSDIETMFGFVRLGRADIALTNHIGGMLILAEQGITDIVPLEPPLERRNFYHFINVKHRDLVPLLDAVIREMTASGELERLTREIEKKVIAGTIAY